MDLKKFVGLQIKELRLTRGMDQEQLAKLLDTTKQSISRYENGDRQANQDILFNLADIFNVSIDYFFPKRESKNLDSIREASEKYGAKSSEYNYFPGSISAGLPINIEGVIHTDKIELPHAVMGKWVEHKDILLMKVNGDSMNKVIPHDSFIAVKPIEAWNLKDGDIVVYSCDGDYSVKRFYKDGDLLVFRPDSTDPTFFEDGYHYSDERLHVHGKVVIYIVELD